MPSKYSLTVALKALCGCLPSRQLADLATEPVATLLDREQQAQHERTLRDLLLPLTDGVRCCYKETMDDDQNNACKDRVLRVIRRVVRRRIAVPRPTGEPE